MRVQLFVMGRTSDARQRLMDAAYHLVCEYSYGAVTIDAICERAAVKKGSFYYFFESKSDLAVAAIDAWWHGREKVIDKIFQSDNPPIDRLQTYLDFVTEIQLNAYAKSGQVLGCPLFTLGAEICVQDERIRMRIVDFLTAVVAVFGRAIAEAQAAGEVPPGDPDTIARMLLTAYEGILMLARIEHNPERVRHLSRDALSAIGVHRETKAPPVPALDPAVLAAHPHG